MATVRTSYNPAEYNRLSWRHFDVWLLLIVLALLAIGLLMIGSATQNSIDPDLANAARRLNGEDVPFETFKGEGGFFGRLSRMLRRDGRAA